MAFIEHPSSVTLWWHKTKGYFYGGAVGSPPPGGQFREWTRVTYSAPVTDSAPERIRST